MIRRPPSSTLTDTFFLYPTLFRSRDGGGGVACDHHQPGTIAFNETPEQRRNAGGDFRLGLGAIGKAAIVRDIDKGCGGQQAARGREHRQSPDPGIEKQYRLSDVHPRRLTHTERRCNEISSPHPFYPITLTPHFL